MARELLLKTGAPLHGEGIRRSGRKDMARSKGVVSGMRSFLNNFWRNFRIFRLRRQIYALERRLGS
jgi:hypothetical protein